MKQTLSQKTTAVLVALLLVFSTGGMLVAESLASPLKAYAAVRTNVKLPKGIAATVNGKRIKEKTITAYIENFRKVNELTTKSAWKKWMKKNKYTSKKVRREVIDYYINQKLYDQLAKKYGVRVTKKDLAAALEETKSMFDSDAEYLEALASSRMTEKEYIEEVLKPNVKLEKLVNKLAKKGVISSNSDKAFSKWFKKYRGKATIKIAKMPKKLPYVI